jgi:hypothetical protein
MVIPEENQQQALRENIIDVAVLQTAYHGCAKKRLNARSLVSSSDCAKEEPYLIITAIEERSKNPSYRYCLMK